MGIGSGIAHNPVTAMIHPGRRRSFVPRNLENITCFKCNEKGHLAANCQKKSFYCDVGNTDDAEHKQSGCVYDRYCTDILLDTGATKTLVRRELVSEEDLLGGEITIRCARGGVVCYPLAAVKICIGGEDIVVKAGVSPLVPLPVMEEPFKRIAMDIVGPLPHIIWENDLY